MLGSGALDLSTFKEGGVVRSAGHVIFRILGLMRKTWYLVCRTLLLSTQYFVLSA